MWLYALVVWSLFGAVSLPTGPLPTPHPPPPSLIHRRFRSNRMGMGFSETSEDEAEDERTRALFDESDDRRTSATGYHDHGDRNNDDDHDEDEDDSSSGADDDDDDDDEETEDERARNKQQQQQRQQGYLGDVAVGFYVFCHLSSPLSQSIYFDFPPSLQ